MHNAAHLVVDLSGHGYGHAAMTVPVLNEVRRRHSNLEVTIRSTVPSSWFSERLLGPFDHIPEGDFGLIMGDPITVLAGKTMAAYADLHAHWPEVVKVAASKLAALKPSAVLSNISYLSLAAAHHCRVPSIAMSSVNWADLFHNYCGEFTGSANILAQMIEAYATAELFLQPGPVMPMKCISNARRVGPIAMVGADRKMELRHRVGVPPDRAVILMAMGGIPTEISGARWPGFDGNKMLVGSTLSVSHPDMLAAPTHDWPFVDLVRSCDVLITKPGYGLITESGCNGTPVLILPRPDWPETQALLEWIECHGRSRTLPMTKFLSGNFLLDIEAVRAMPVSAVPEPTGIVDAAVILEAWLH